RRKLAKLVCSGFPSVCILFQLFRLASFVMFSIFMIDCTLYHDSTSVDCSNFTVYNTPMCDPYCWKTLWLACSIFTSIAWICLLNKTQLRELTPVRNRMILKCLVRKPYFWSLNLIAVVIVLYDVLIMVHNKNARIHVECLVILSKLCTVYLLYQLNFTFPPCRQNDFRPISRAAYCITLFIYVLDNGCKFLVVSAQAAFKFYTVNHDKPKSVNITDLMLMVINASLYHSFLEFFWQKLFCGDKDILKVVKQKFMDSAGVRENIQNDDVMITQPGIGPGE
ncbi:hypothetical protein ACROYT_G024365, partial [Oculina patagonica]